VQSLAFVLLLACAASRTFLGEMPYRLSALRPAAAGPKDPAAGDRPDRTELGRMVYAASLLACAGLWTLGAVLSRRLAIRRGWLLAMIAAFAAWSLVSALHASDRRSALDCWIEQVAILLAGWTALQCCAERRHFALTVAVLAAVAATLAAKGLWQVLVEVPERVADFEMYRLERLRQFGWAAGSPQAQLIEKRLRDPAPFGFFALANLFAALLLVVAAALAGLAADKLAFALCGRREPSAPRKRGEVHLPTLAAGLTVAMALAAVAVLVLTRSRGGILAAAAAAAGGGAVVWFGRRLARHWRKAVLAAGAALLAGLGGVAAYGLRHDRLPTTTMTFRWFYWTASAEIVAENPLWGVGPGNFHQAYLQHRRPAAEEAVKMPHNFIAHALTQFGVPGGAIYLALVACVLAALARPANAPAAPDEKPAHPAEPPPPWRGPLAALVAAVLAGRAAFGPSASPYMLVLDGVLPACVLAACFLAARWAGAPRGGGPGRFSRVALACGLGGFVLHNLVEYGLWVPATAGVFWIAAGACLARAGGGRPRDVSALRWPALAAAAVAVWAACQFLLAPVAARATYAGAVGDDPAAAQAAARADPLDPVAAGDAAKALLAHCPRAGEAPALLARLDDAQRWAEQAASRDPANYAWCRLVGQIAWYRACPDAFVFAWPGQAGEPSADPDALRAVLARDPGNLAAKSDLAAAHYAAGRFAESAALGLELAYELERSAVLRVHLGNALWRAGRGEQALEEWRRAARLAPRTPEARAAMDWMERAVRLNPQEIRLRLDLASMLADAGRGAECAEQLDAAERIEAALVNREVSVQRFSPDELAEIEMLRRRAALLVAGGDADGD